MMCYNVLYACCTLSSQPYYWIVQKLSFYTENGSGAIFGKMLLVMIVENNRIDDYFRTS